MRLFGDQGYEATTVEQIAADAEVSTATFYRYYCDKEDVVVNPGDIDDLIREVLAARPERKWCSTRSGRCSHAERCRSKATARLSSCGCA